MNDAPPRWTGMNGDLIAVKEYTPGRWTGMITTRAEYDERMAKRRREAAAFEREIERDFGPQYECNDCGDAKFVRLNVPLHDDRFGQSIPCPCTQRARPLSSVSDFARAGIPEGYLRSCTIESFEGPQSKLAREYIASWPPRKPFLFLLGERGNGKTHLSVALLRALWESKRQWGRFCPVSEVLAAVRASYEPTSDVSADGIMSPYKTAPLLVLDDIGVGKQTPWVDEQLWLLVNWRYTRGLPTIASANPDGVERVEARVKERLMDIQIGETWRFAGRNRRVA